MVVTGSVPHLWIHFLASPWTYIIAVSFIALQCGLLAGPGHHLLVLFPHTGAVGQPVAGGAHSSCGIPLSSWLAFPEGAALLFLLPARSHGIIKPHRYQLYNEKEPAEQMAAQVARSLSKV